MPEGCGELLQREAALGDSLRIRAEQFREHLTDYARHVVTVAVQVARASEAAQAGAVLEVMHAGAHHFDASPDRAALLLVETSEHPDDPLHIAHQVALCGQGLRREAPHDLACQRARLLLAAYRRREALQEAVGLRGRYRRLILDGVGDPAQQICAGYRGAQRRPARPGGSDSSGGLA